MPSISGGHTALPARDGLPAIGVVLIATDCPSFAGVPPRPPTPPLTAVDQVCASGFRSAAVKPVCSACCDFTRQQV